MVKLNVQENSNEGRDSPDIFRAALRNDAQELYAAIKDGQNLDMVDRETLMTPMHVACANRSLEFLNAALELDYDPWIRDRNLRLAFDHAAAQDLTDVGIKLLDKLYPKGEPERFFTPL